MVYATYDYYCEKYGGVAISDDNVFWYFARKASTYIDKFTFGRINEGNVDSFPSLQPCVCDMADVLFFEESKKAQGNGGKEKKSETTDGYSVTYVTEGRDGELWEEKLTRKLYSIAKLYLINTGLLYLGVE